MVARPTSVSRGQPIYIMVADTAAAVEARCFGVGNDINGNPKPYTRSGLREVFAGEAAADYFKVRPGNERVPDVFGISQ